MSKQLALSSAFATFAMVALTLTHTPDRSGLDGGDSVFAIEAELPAMEMPGPSLLPN